MTPKTRIFELGCGTGFLGLALRAAGAGHVTLSDEFVELACANASLTEDGCRCAHHRSKGPVGPS